MSLLPGHTCDCSTIPWYNHRMHCILDSDLNNTWELMSLSLHMMRFYPKQIRLMTNLNLKLYFRFDMILFFVRVQYKFLSETWWKKTTLLYNITGHIKNLCASVGSRGLQRAGKFSVNFVNCEVSGDLHANILHLLRFLTDSLYNS